MGFAENFKDLQIWQRSRLLTNEIYDAFEKIRDFEFRSQIQRASVSVMNNISEGFERRTKKDFAHFLDLSKGSSGEVRSMLYLAEDRRYIDKSFAERLRLATITAPSNPPQATRYPLLLLSSHVFTRHQLPATSYSLGQRSPCPGGRRGEEVLSIFEEIALVWGADGVGCSA